LAKAKVIAEIPKSKADEPEYFINFGHFRIEDYFLFRKKTPVATAIAPTVNQFRPAQVLRSKWTRKTGLYNAANTPKIQAQVTRFKVNL